MTKHGSEVITEDRVPERRLGRNINYDSASAGFRITSNLRAVEPYESVFLHRWVQAFDQGDLGSCTGNAGIGALATAPLRVGRGGYPALRPKGYNEKAAVELYKENTLYDPFQGAYPPNDTGSDILTTMKRLQAHGWIDYYEWAFNLEEFLIGLSFKSCAIMGCYWRANMDFPDDQGVVSFSGPIRGGHAFTIVGYDLNTGLAEAVNSWGNWGLNGRFFIPLTDIARMIDQDGECAFGLRNA